MRNLKSLVTAVAGCLFITCASLHAESVLNLGVPQGSFGETSPVVTSGTINGAVYSTSDLQPAGTGVIDSFLRVQMNGSEQGFNTSGRFGAQAPMDDKSDLTYTHDLQLNSVGQVILGGTSYYEFLLDINEDTGGQDHSNGYLSLLQLKIFQSNTAQLLGPDETSLPTAFGTPSAPLAYDMDAPPAGDNRVDLNYNLSSGGSGIADMFLYVPTANFNPNLTYVYLYSSFGNPDKNGTPPPYPSDSGFEEWATAKVSSGSAVPLPNVAWCSMALLATLAIWRRRAISMA